MHAAACSLIPCTLDPCLALPYPACQDARDWQVIEAQRLWKFVTSRQISKGNVIIPLWSIWNEEICKGKSSPMNMPSHAILVLKISFQKSVFYQSSLYFVKPQEQSSVIEDENPSRASQTEISLESTTHTLKQCHVGQFNSLVQLSLCYWVHNHR